MSQDRKLGPFWIFFWVTVSFVGVGAISLLLEPFINH